MCTRTEMRRLKWSTGLAELNVSSFPPNVQLRCVHVVRVRLHVIPCYTVGKGRGPITGPDMQLRFVGVRVCGRGRVIPCYTIMGKSRWSTTGPRQGREGVWAWL